MIFFVIGEQSRISIRLNLIINKKINVIFYYEKALGGICYPCRQWLDWHDFGNKLWKDKNNDINAKRTG